MDFTYRRALVLRYSLDGELLGEWTSGSEQLEEDGAMGRAAARLSVNSGKLLG